MSSRRGLLFVISAPSGTGKTTLVERLVQILGERDDWDIPQRPRSIERTIRWLDRVVSACLRNFEEAGQTIGFEALEFIRSAMAAKAVCRQRVQEIMEAIGARGENTAIGRFMAATTGGLNLEYLAGGSWQQE